MISHTLTLSKYSKPAILEAKKYLKLSPLLVTICNHADEDTVNIIYKHPRHMHPMSVHNDLYVMSRVVNIVEMLKAVYSEL